MAADEFSWIDSLRPLTRGDTRALNLMDDAAVIPSRSGRDMVVSVDAMVEGVHFTAHEQPGIVGRRLLRTSLSDLAAKAAKPFGYFLTIALPTACGRVWQTGFRAGLAEDGDEFGVALLGGDTVATPGPLTLSATVLGWTAAGGAVLRSTALPGHTLVVCGVIGDGWLGLRAARGEIADPGGRLAAHYRTPRPLLALRELLRRHARAAADVSDGLLADAGHIAAASGLGLAVELSALPLSLSGAAWRAAQGADDEGRALLQLATGGDDYAIVCAVDPGEQGAFREAAAALGVPAAAIGQFNAEPGLQVSLRGVPLAAPGSLGWRH